MSYRNIIWIVTILLSSFSCSIKEDRSNCPCQLNITFENPDKIRNTAEVLMYAYSKHEGLIAHETLAAESVRKGYRKMVTRDSIAVFSATGARKSEIKSHALRALSFHEWDSLYVASGKYDCSPDEVHGLLGWHKEFSTITILIPDESIAKRYDFYLEAECDGIGMVSFEPVEGLYIFRMRRLSPLIRQARIPRQRAKGTQLSLILTPSGEQHILQPTFPDGETMQKSIRLNIAATLAEQGYDWNKNDLDDITAELQLTEAGISLSVDLWRTEDIGDIHF